MPAGLRWASNMGHLDVFPETSGKAQVAKYLLKRLDGVASSSFLLCDDANDMSAHPGAWSGSLKGFFPIFSPLPVQGYRSGSGGSSISFLLCDDADNTREHS